MGKKIILAIIILLSVIFLSSIFLFDKIMLFNKDLQPNAQCQEEIDIEVMGYSMFPLFKEGDTIIGCQNVSKEDLKVGDIIGFKVEEFQIQETNITSITHRIIFKFRDKYITKGDNCWTFDWLIVDYEDVIFELKSI